MARRYTIGLNIIQGDLLGISKGKDSGGYLITLLLLKASSPLIYGQDVRADSVLSLTDSQVLENLLLLFCQKSRNLG